MWGVYSLLWYTIYICYIIYILYIYIILYIYYIYIIIYYIYIYLYYIYIIYILYGSVCDPGLHAFCIHQSEGLKKRLIWLIFVRKWGLFASVPKFVCYWMLIYLGMCCYLCVHIYVCLWMYWYASLRIYTYFRSLLMGRGEKKRECE